MERTEKRRGQRESARKERTEGGRGVRGETRTQGKSEWGEVVEGIFRNYQKTKRCRSQDELVEVIVCTFNTVYCFQFSLYH